MRQLPVSVVISTYQEGPRLRDTVASILSSSPSPAEVIIVDDGSTDGSCDDKWAAPVFLLRQPHRGIALSRNAGAKVAGNSVLVFVDAHCRVDASWLEPLYMAIEENPEALVGAAVSDSNDARGVGCGATIVSPLLEYRWNIAKLDQKSRVQVVPGGCMAVERARFLAHGGFGPFNGFGLEDVDLSLAWHAARRPVFGIPQSRVVHDFRMQAPYPWERDHWTENLLRTAVRHLTGERLRRTILAAAHLPGFASAVAHLMSSPMPPLPEFHVRAIEELLAESTAWGDLG